jgi:hypothetical protein
MSEIERILYIAEDHGCRLEVLAEAAKIKQSSPRRDLSDLYTDALETVMRQRGTI